MALGNHQFTTRVENTETKEAGEASAAFDLTLQEIKLTSITDDVGAVQGNILNSDGTGSDTGDATQTYGGTLALALQEGQKVGVYAHAVFLGYAEVTGTQWTFTTSELGQDNRTMIFKIETTADPKVVLASTEASVNTTVSDTLSDNILTVGGYDRTIDLTKVAGLEQQPRIDSVNLEDGIEGTGSNKIILDIDDVLAAGTDLFNSANGWEGLESNGRNQIHIDGDQDDVIGVQGTDWVSAGTVTFGGTVYLIYNNGNNAQLLIDDELIRLGTVGGEVL